VLRAPSRRKRKGKVERLNLIPILDAVFIFIFFLLMSANFVKIYEVQSDVPIISTRPPKSQKKPLALTLKVTKNGLNLYTGVPSKLVKKIKKTREGDYNLERLHNFMINIKKRHKEDRSLILDPLVDIDYEAIVKIMDAVRMYRNTDDKVWIKDSTGIDIQAQHLFDQIVFGNIRS